MKVWEYLLRARVSSAKHPHELASGLDGRAAEDNQKNNASEFCQHNNPISVLGVASFWMHGTYI
eukprot:scaffold48831_cov51-Prasinocladus_malaysianus.AAC.1